MEFGVFVTAAALPVQAGDHEISPVHLCLSSVSGTTLQSSSQEIDN